MSNKQNDEFYEAKKEAEEEYICPRCNGNGCPACDTERKNSKYNPEPF
jgi:hypothetical protein